MGYLVGINNSVGSGMNVFKIPALMMYSLKNGILKSPASITKVDFSPGNSSAKPQLSVLKHVKAPKLMMP